MTPYTLRNVLILGAGRSGLAVARLVHREGGKALLIDEREHAEARSLLESLGMNFHVAPRETLPEGDFSLIVTSPSFALDHPWIVQAATRPCPLVSELELGASLWRGAVIAITGSKGKSSVVKCLASTLELAGHPAVPAGNYGIPLCERVMTCEADGYGVVAVTEVSSFQMEHTPTFAPKYAAILNLQADHLDRHGDLETYADLKFALFTHATPETMHAYLPWDLAQRRPLAHTTFETFGTESQAHWHYADGVVQGRDMTVPVDGYFKNPVLGNAAALIVAILSDYGLSPEMITRGFQAFEPLPHRMQRIGEYEGVTYINDSKATSLAATQAAIRMVGSRVRLIAGGLLKESELTFLLPTLRESVRKVYLIGSSQHLLYDAWHAVVPCECCDTMAIAVQKATQEASSGETILLSPGTASFDQYTGMAARGADFIAQVQAATHS